MKNYVLIPFAFILQHCFTQTILTLQPGPEDGKDAKIWSIESNVNFGDHTELRAMAWTWFGDEGAERSYLAFDLSKIPTDAEICYAYLSLYANDSSSTQTNSSLSGPNISLLRRVITPWDENLVTWIAPPSVTTVNQVTIPESEEEFEDVLNIDVTGLISDMVVDPVNSHGFELRLETESFYRRRVFATSDDPDSTHHPKLEVCYSLPVSINSNNQEAKINIYPNPSNGPLIIELNNYIGIDVTITVSDLLGKQILLHKVTPQSNLFNYQISKTELAGISGIAVVHVIGNTQSYSKSILITN